MDNIVYNINEWAKVYLEVSYYAIPLYFLAGLVSNVLPCNYSLIPITVGILQNRSLHQQQSLWIHPMFYWAGIVFNYTILGLIAALSGTAFNRWIHLPIVTLFIAIVFLLLFFVSLNWLHIHISTESKMWKKIKNKPALTITFLMGCIAGFISSACTAPVLVAVLVSILQNVGS